MDLNIFDIAQIISDNKKCIEFLHGRNLLIQDYHCCREIVQKYKIKRSVTMRCSNVKNVGVDIPSEFKVFGRNQNLNCVF